MLRAVLLGILAVSATTACGSNHDEPRVDPAAPAGKVLEVSGTVTIGAKPLAVGDTVKANDLIETGADSSVVIKLAHNDARWELGPNHKSKPTDSVAWTAERSTGPAKPVDQDTSAAGRPAERSAADTATSAPAVAPSSSKGARGEPKPPSKIEQPKRAKPDENRSSPGDSGAPNVQPVPPPPPDVGAKPDPVTNPLAALTACLVKGQKVTIKIHLEHHVPTITFVGDVDPKVKACITDAAKTARLPAESGDAQLDLTKSK